MSSPETDWVDGIIPPARHWRVVNRYIGVHSGRIFDDADACFASDAICRRIYSRYPVDRDGNYRPIAFPQPVDPADLSGGGGYDADPGPDRDDDHVPAAGDGGDDDPGCGPGTEGMQPDHGDRRDADHLLLANADVRTGTDPGVPDVRDPSASAVLQEGELT
jgi:hypothetical protein